MYVTLNLLLDICPISSCPFIANQEEEPAGPAQQNRLAAIWANVKLLKFCYFEQYSGKCILGKCCIWYWMDHRVFQFATRGQCIKGKKLDCFEHNHIFCFNCNVLALLSFYALPSGGNRKTRWSIENVGSKFCLLHFSYDSQMLWLKWSS